MKLNNIFRLGLGAMPLSISKRPSEKDSIEIIATFLDQGGNFIDTANVYGLDDTDRGHNENLIYKALKKLGQINDVVVATKGGASRPNGGWGLGEGHPGFLRAACEQSLLNLNISSHSLYYLHGPDPSVPLEDSLGELILLKQEGKIQHLGIANVTLAQLQLALTQTELAAVQNRCNPFCKADLNNGVYDLCQTTDMLYVSYCPLGGWADHQTLAANPLYKHLTERYQASPQQLSLAWLLTKGRHIFPIPGMDRKEQVKLNIQATSMVLEAEDISSLDHFPDLYLPYHSET